MLPIRDHTPSTRWPIVTVSLIALNAIAFYLEWTSPDLEAFVYRWALVPSVLDPVTFITSQFLHGGFAHIGFNMWYLWIFGDNVEGHFGHGKFLLFYLASGIMAALTQVFFSLGSDVPMLGASGAVAGVLGAYWALFPRHEVDALLPTPVGFFYRRLPASIVLVFWFVGQLLSGVASLGVPADEGGVAFWAHIGGFVFGWIMGKVTVPRRPVPENFSSL